MAQVSLKNIKKVYPVSKDKKHKKREEGPNLQITEEGVVAVQQFSLDIADREFCFPCCEKGPAKADRSERK